jgi:hypothetical protein
MDELDGIIDIHSFWIRADDFMLRKIYDRCFLLIFVSFLIMLGIDDSNNLAIIEDIGKHLIIINGNQSIMLK